MTIAEYLSLPENQNANLVMPIPWCPHLETISENFDVKDYDVKRLCEICNNEGENWICLVCHKVFCSRYVNEHMVIHSAEAQHLVTLSFSDISGRSEAFCRVPSTIAGMQQSLEIWGGRYS